MTILGDLQDHSLIEDVPSCQLTMAITNGRPRPFEGIEYGRPRPYSVPTHARVITLAPGNQADTLPIRPRLTHASEYMRSIFAPPDIMEIV